MSEPRKWMQELVTIQAEQVAWQQKNFPGRAMHQPLLGIVEEFGELYEAECKESQAEICDAIGDVLIFMCDYCTAMGIQISEIGDQANEFDATDEDLDLEDEFHFDKWVGRLCHSHLKFEQRIRGTPRAHMHDIRDALARLMLGLQLLLDDTPGLPDTVGSVAWATWLSVRERDWSAQRAQAAAEGG